MLNFESVMNGSGFPNFIVIGANKAGTSSLHAYLSQHPQIHMSSPKEPMYFLMVQKDRAENSDARVAADKMQAALTWEDYLKLFQTEKEVVIRGESSTAYLANPQCAERIKEKLPDVKLCVVLRNPVDRAFSNYKMYVKRGAEKMSFKEAVEEEKKTGRLNYPDGMRYLSLSRYSNSIQTYLNLFGEEQLMIFTYEDFSKNTSNVLRKLYRFLGVNEDFEANVGNSHNVGSILRFPEQSLMNRLLVLLSKGFRKIGWKSLGDKINKKRFVEIELEEDLKESLKVYFREDIVRLEGLTKLDLSKWK